MSEEPSRAGLETLLEYIRANRGFDCTGYKRSSLLRRISRRREEVGARDCAGYQDYLAAHPEEFSFLFVTSFFRDTAAWRYLQQTVIPRLLDATPEHVPLRVWCVDCSSGEEPCTIIMLLAEAMGIERFRQQVEIYATDVDEEALEHARQALYTPKQLEPVPDAYRAKYFQESDGRFAFHGDLRRSVIFGRHDLIQDAQTLLTEHLTGFGGDPGYGSGGH